MFAAGNITADQGRRERRLLEFVMAGDEMNHRAKSGQAEIEIKIKREQPKLFGKGVWTNSTLIKTSVWECS